MKKLFIGIGIILFAHFSYGSYFFPDSTASWSEVVVEYCGTGCIPSMGYFDYSINGDTIIDTNKYYQVYEYQVAGQYTYYFGAIRTDSSKVYFVKASETVEILLYDFSLTVGDYYHSSFFGHSYQVLSIDTILVAGTQRKRLFFDDPNNEIGTYWIEGIGSNRGVLKPIKINDILLCGCGMPQDWCLVDFYEDSIFQYNQTPCVVIQNVENHELIDIDIFPNPTTGLINIKAESIENIEIVNIEGRQVYSGKENKIDLRNVPKGIYIIEVITNNQTITKKLIKQ